VTFAGYAEVAALTRGVCGDFSGHYFVARRLRAPGKRRDFCRLRRSGRGDFSGHYFVDHLLRAPGKMRDLAG